MPSRRTENGHQGDDAGCDAAGWAVWPEFGKAYTARRRSERIIMLCLPKTPLALQLQALRGPASQAVAFTPSRHARTAPKPWGRRRSRTDVSVEPHSRPLLDRSGSAREFQMAEVALLYELFAAILNRIQGFGVSPPSV